MGQSRAQASAHRWARHPAAEHACAKWVDSAEYKQPSPTPDPSPVIFYGVVGAAREKLGNGCPFVAKAVMLFGYYTLLHMLS